MIFYLLQNHVATWLCFPTLRLLVSRFIGFLFLKNLLVLPVKNIQHYWEGMCLSLYPTMSHSRRRHSAESFFKSWFEDSEYLLLIVVSSGFEPARSPFLSLNVSTPGLWGHVFQWCFIRGNTNFRHLTIFEDENPSVLMCHSDLTLTHIVIWWFLSHGNNMKV